MSRERQTSVTQSERTSEVPSSVESESGSDSSRDALRSRSDAAPSLDMTNIVEILVVSAFVTGGAFVASAWLVGAIGSGQLLSIGAVQLALSGVGAGLLAISLFGRWLISAYG